MAAGHLGFLPGQRSAAAIAKWVVPLRECAAAIAKWVVPLRECEELVGVATS
jgi:hypothetical protein